MFNPKLSITNSLNAIQNSFQYIQQSIVNNTNGDINQVKADVEQTNGDNGVPWVHGSNIGRNGNYADGHGQPDGKDYPVMEQGAIKNPQK